MSEQDRFDWNDDVEFGEKSMDMEDGDCIESSLEGFDDFDDMSDYGSEDSGKDESPAEDAWAGMDKPEPGNPEMKTDQAEETETKDVRPPMRSQVSVKRRSGISAIGMGFLFAASILVAGIGVGGAVLFAEGVNPASLWQPKEFMQVDQWLNFSEHPLNIIYLVSLGITFLALLGSYRMGKVAVESNARTRAAEEMLDRVCALRFDDQEAWRDEQFKAFGPAEEFVIKTLGAWRLQEARQKRLLGIEGEIHRLEMALSSDSRTDLTGHYDNPAIGRLVDEMLRHFDARDAAVKKVAEVEKRDGDSGHEILDTVHASCAWNWKARGRVEDGGMEATRLADALNTLAGDVHEAASKADGGQGMLDVLTGVRAELDVVAKSAGQSTATQDSGDELNDLVDRGSKLAFQIAMEVTRLGPRGERLLPMSQALEDLTTGFRKAVDSLPSGGKSGASKSNLSSVSAKLDSLEELLKAEMDTNQSDLSGPISVAAPVAAKLAEDMASLAEDFDSQGDRLNDVGQAVGDLSGQTFEPEEAPESKKFSAEVEPLVLDRQEVRQSDPVSNAETNSFVDQSSGFTLDREPKLETPLSGAEEKVYDLGSFGASPMEMETPEPEPGPVTEPEVEEEVFELDTFGAAPLDTQDEEPVYDLDQFAAEPLDTAAPGAGDEETVYDLDKFGAEPMALSTEEATDEEPVYEMSELGGDMVLEEAPEEVQEEAQEEVLELETFGAVPLEDSVDVDEPEEDVFDLNQFGAKSLD